MLPIQKHHDSHTLVIVGDVSDGSDPFGWVGATIDGKYRVEFVAGVGGYGVVYRATHATLNDSVAVKCLRLPHIEEGRARDRFLEDFLAEGRHLLRLAATPGVVRVRDAGVVDSPNGTWCPYLVLEWLEGRTLAQDLAARLEQGAPGRSLAEAVALLAPAVQAVVAAHREGIAHRDLKPANLFLAEARGGTTLKVLDFGAAKVMDAVERLNASTAATGIAPRRFTAAYGAPEQFDISLGASGPWSDVHALALVLIEVVTGRRALRGESAPDLHRIAVDRSSRPALTAELHVGDAVERVLQRALAVQPLNRYQTAAAFWEELTAAARPRARPSTSEVTTTGGAEVTSSRTEVMVPVRVQDDAPSVESAPRTRRLPRHHGPGVPAPAQRGSQQPVRIAVALGVASGLALCLVAAVTLFNGRRDVAAAPVVGRCIDAGLDQDPATVRARVAASDDPNVRVRFLECALAAGEGDGGASDRRDLAVRVSALYAEPFRAYNLTFHREQAVTKWIRPYWEDGLIVHTSFSGCHWVAGSRRSATCQVVVRYPDGGVSSPVTECFVWTPDGAIESRTNDVACPPPRAAAHR